MNHKKGNGTAFAVLIFMMISICSTQANKFDFPSNAIGVNYSAVEELKPFLIYNPVDLGIDNTDTSAPLHIKNALANATLSDDITLNQYTDSIGLPRFLKAVAKFYSPLIGRELIPGENVLATIGATGGVYDAFQGHTNPGDEWIVIQPAYSMYLPMIQLARGVPKFTNLKLTKNHGRITGEDWVIDREHMESLFNNKTKGILLNNPLNPLGKVYTLDELQFIASLAQKYNTLVVSDEAHEWVTYKPHIRIASLPGMWERTISIGSSSKTFSVGGFRVGWAYGSANILNNLKTIHERTGYSAPTPQQAALAFGFEQEYLTFGKADSFFSTHRREVEMKRDFMVKVFEEVGMRPSIPDGGYCMVVDYTTLKSRPLANTKNSSMNFIKWLIKNVGVLGLPMTYFYADENKHLGENWVRYCFHKHENTLKTAKDRLQKLRAYRS